MGDLELAALLRDVLEEEDSRGVVWTTLREVHQAAVRAAALVIADGEQS